MPGRISTEEKKRVAKTQDFSGVKKIPPAYDTVTRTFIYFEEVESEPYKRERSDFRKSVEPATTGTCMFCSRTDAAFAFRGDDSVRICEGCVK